MNAYFLVRRPVFSSPVNFKKKFLGYSGMSAPHGIIKSWRNYYSNKQVASAKPPRRCGAPHNAMNLCTGSMMRKSADGES